MNIVLYGHLNWFQRGPLPEGFSGTYDYALVALSFFIAILGSYVAFDFAGNLQAEQSKLAKMIWVISGAFIMAASIWSMHFVGLLAFVMSIPIQYDLYWTIGSFFSAIVGSTIAFYLFQLKKPSLWNLVLCGISMGVALIFMNYVGMEAMEGTTILDIRYVPSLFFLSVIMALFASMIALISGRKSMQGSPESQFRLKIFGAIAMGLAVCAMHYVSMAAAIFIPQASPVTSLHVIGSYELAFFVTAAMGIIVIIALIVSSQRHLRLTQLEREIEIKYRKEVELSRGSMMQRMAAVGRVAAGAAHEINNPLSYALSNLWTLQKYTNLIFQLQDLYQSMMIEVDRWDDEKIKDIIKKINLFYDEKKIDFMRGDIYTLLLETNDGLDRIKEIIANLRYFSSTEKEIKTTIDINEVIELSLKLAANKINPECTINKNFSQLPPIYASKSQLSVVFSNLLMNAGQSIAGKGEITISTLAMPSHILIEIVDNGHGIAPENLSKIFTPFFTTRPIGMGAGLGLSTAFAIIQLYNGTITVNSDVGKGSVFSVLLPIDTNVNK